ncbi:MAG: hypothetical protein OEM96_00015 [Gemmatimonadota bacterium]|nr:hypothetical protein [Gemmatimonadota bacterium]
MFGLRGPGVETVGSGGAGWRPALTTRWLKDAVFAHRLAFEREMRRDRRGLERRFKAYLKKEHARHD